MHIKAPAAALLALIFSAALVNAAPMKNPNMISIKMTAQNNSGENGTATLTQMPTGVKVVISLTGAPNSAQPAHIHTGTCANLNPAPKYMLHNVVAGHSTTVVGAKLSSLIRGSFAINVHKSLTDLKTYVSCGNIK